MYDVDLPEAGRHSVVIITRDSAIPALTSVVVALITSTIRDLPIEVPVGTEHGLDYDCVINCDNLFLVPKDSFGPLRGRLGPEQLFRLRRAIIVALGLEQPI